MTGNIDVIDIQTGQVIKTKMLNNTCIEEKQEKEKRPDAIDKDALLNRCLYQNVVGFMRTIVPWTEIVQIPFVKDSTIPELERGINQAKMGGMVGAIRIFSGVAETSERDPSIKPKSIANAYWNLGLAYEYAWEFDRAIDAFEKAYTFYPDDAYIRERSNVERMRANRERLKEQGL